MVFFLSWTRTIWESNKNLLSPSPLDSIYRWTKTHERKGRSPCAHAIIPIQFLRTAAIGKVINDCRPLFQVVFEETARFPGLTERVSPASKRCRAVALHLTIHLQQRINYFSDQFTVRIRSHYDMSRPFLRSSDNADTFRSLIKLRIDHGYGSKIDDRAPSDALDHRGGNDQTPKMFSLKIHRTVYDPPGNQHTVDHAVVRITKRKDHRSEYHSAQKMRQIRHRLKSLFQAPVRHFVDEYGKQNGSRKIEQQTQKIQTDRIKENWPEVHIGKKAFKMGKAHPLRSERIPKTI